MLKAICWSHLHYSIKDKLVNVNWITGRLLRGSVAGGALGIGVQVKQGLGAVCGWEAFLPP